MDEERIERLEELLRKLGVTIREAVGASNEVKDRLTELEADGWDGKHLLEAMMPKLHDDIPGVVGDLVVAPDADSTEAGYRLDAADARWLAAIGISPTRYRSHPQRPLPPLEPSLPPTDGDDRAGLE